MIRAGDLPRAAYWPRMRFLRVVPSFAIVTIVAALAACGGGGGGGGGGSALPPGGGGGIVPTPTASPVPTSTPTTAPASGYVAPTGGVTELSPATSNQFSSSLLATSTDGTFIVQSADAPAEPPASAATLTEYDVVAAESAAGQKPSAVWRGTSATARADARGRIPYRPAMDYRSGLLRGMSQQIVSHLGTTRSIESFRSTRALAQGTQRTFHIIQGTITGNSSSCAAPQQTVNGQCYLDVPATLQFVSSHGYVWVDNGFDQSYGFSGTDWQTAGAKFDAAYARETTAFAPAFFQPSQHYSQCDTNGNTLPPASSQPPVDLTGSDQHISILVTRALENTGEGGYFFFGDLLNDQEFNCATHAAHIPSNALPMFVIGGDKYAVGSGTVADASYWRNVDMPRSVAHEFQHYLHAINKVMVPNLVNNQSVAFDDAFIDEGDAMLAQDLVNAGNAQDTNALETSFSYLYSPSNFSLTAFTGYDANPLDTSSNPSFGFFHNTGGNYGAAYLFARYLYDRFGGDAALHRQYASLVPSPGSSTSANVGPILAEANNGQTFAQLYQDFAAALAARNVASTDPRFTFNSTVFLVGTKQVPIPGGQSYDLVMNGPRSPADLTSLHPYDFPRIKLTPSTSVTAKLIIGATLFFNAAPSAGSITSLNSTTAPLGHVDGGLVQGAYNDNGSCFGPPPQC